VLGGSEKERLVRTLRRRRRDESGSLALAMLVTIAGVGMSTVLMATTIQVVQGSRVEQTKTAALQGARAGVSSALGAIRSAVDTSTGLGSVAKLPCATLPSSPQVTGKVGAASTISYRVSISYFTQDPASHLQDSSWMSANGKPCVTQLTPSGALPAYAYVESTGTDSQTGSNRTLFGVYAFHTVVNANVPGGQIHDWKTNAGSPDLCLDAGAAPGAGTTLTMQNCATKPDGTAVDRQKFGYQPGLVITLTTADPATFPTGLCIDAGSPQKANNVLKLQNCATTTAGALRQEWSFNFASGFFGTTDGVNLNTFCWSITNPDTAGSPITLNDTAGSNGKSACNTNYPNNFQTWNPSPEVGPGAAGQPIPTSELGGLNIHASQLVNFDEFGRCLDVTYEDVTKPYEVVFQCKQSPTLDLQNNWNQAWASPVDGATGPIYTYTMSADKNFYCLTMPTLPAGPALVTVAQCNPAAPAANQIWWSRGPATTSADQQYRIEGLGAWAGYCLASLTDQPAWQQANKAGLQVCNGDKIQKWNAVASSSPSGMSAIGER
jgi:hypothetical protein